MWFMASAVGLYMLISVLSPGTESTAKYRILLIALGSALFQRYFTETIPGAAGLIAALATSLGIVVVGLIFWCRVDRKPALKITAAYLALCIALGVLYAILLHWASAP